jgi:hypothetical protein
LPSWGTVYVGTFQMRTFLILAAGTLSLSGPAFGQAACTSLGSECACAAPLANFTPGSASLAIQGSVMLEAQNPGPDPSAPFLSVGDSAVVLDNGSAALSFPGACSASLGPQSSLVIRAIDGCACAAVSEASTEAEAAAVGAGIDAGLVVGGVVAAGAAGTAVYFVATDDDEGSEE